MRNQPCIALPQGLVAEVATFLFGTGFAIAGGDLWKARRRAVGPSLHRCGAPGGQRKKGRHGMDVSGGGAGHGILAQ